MLADTPIRAVRQLSVDCANLMGQVAMYKAYGEGIQELLQQIDTRSWERRQVGTGEDLKFETVLPPDQVAAVERLLALVSDLR